MLRADSVNAKDIAKDMGKDIVLMNSYLATQTSVKAAYFCQAGKNRNAVCARAIRVQYVFHKTFMYTPWLPEVSDLHSVYWLHTSKMNASSRCNINMDTRSEVTECDYASASKTVSI